MIAAPPEAAIVDLGMSGWFDVLLFTPFLLALLLLAYFWRQGATGVGYIRKQSDYLDHQRTINERALEQNKAIEEMIARQYDETNARADRALAQADEAIRLQAAALEQLLAMNETLSRLALRTDAQDRPG